MRPPYVFLPPQEEAGWYSACAALRNSLCRNEAIPARARLRFRGGPSGRPRLRGPRPRPLRVDRRMARRGRGAWTGLEAAGPRRRPTPPAAAGGRGEGAGAAFAEPKLSTAPAAEGGRLGVSRLGGGRCREEGPGRCPAAPEGRTGRDDSGRVGAGSQASTP